MQARKPEISALLNPAGRYGIPGDIPLSLGDMMVIARK
jgi:hypothetical protein